MSNVQSSKTLSAIALALMLCYYLFKSETLLHVVLILLFLVVFPNRVSRAMANSWLKFSEVLGQINSKIILTIIYFVVLVPVSFCYKRLNRKRVEYYDGRNLDSFFVETTSGFTRDLFEKTW